jgi:hypothetical protein
MALFYTALLLAATLWFGFRAAEARRGRQKVGMISFNRADQPVAFWVSFFVHLIFFALFLSVSSAILAKELRLI